MRSFSIDVDGVLARNNTHVYLAICNRVLSLGIEEKQLIGLKRSAFLQHPAVNAYSMRVGAETARRAFGWLYFHKEVLLAAKPFRGAAEGVRWCYEQAAPPHFCYCTARYSSDSAWNLTIQDGTRTWLKEQDFPAPDQVVFCKGYQDKMLQLARIARECPSLQHYHIDDSWQQLIVYLPTMPCNFHLLAFGSSEEELPEGIEAFPNWNIIGQKLEKENYEGITLL